MMSDAEREGLIRQRELLGQSLGKVLIAMGFVRADASMTGPELLLAADTAIEHLNADRTRRAGATPMVSEAINALACYSPDSHVGMIEYNLGEWVRLSDVRAALAAAPDAPLSSDRRSLVEAAVDGAMIDLGGCSVREIAMRAVSVALSAVKGVPDAGVRGEAVGYGVMNSDGIVMVSCLAKDGPVTGKLWKGWTRVALVPLDTPTGPRSNRGEDGA